MAGTKDALKFLSKDAGGTALGAGLILMNSEMSKSAKLWEIIKLKALPISASIAGSIFGISTAIKAAIKNSGILEESFRKLDKIQFATSQFETLYKSLDKAKQRVASLIQLTSKGVFKFEDAAEASRALSILSNRALDTDANLTRLADSAAATGVSMAEMGMAVGEAHRALAAGGGDSGLGKLRMLGVVSEETTEKIQTLAATGGTLAQMWQLVESDLDAAKGKMEEASNSIQGLTSQYEKARSAMATAFGSNFVEEEKETIAATTQVVQNLTPAAQELGAVLSTVTGFAEKWEMSFKAAATSIPGITEVVGFLARAVVIAGGAIASFGLWRLIADGGKTAKSLLSLVGAVGKTSSTFGLMRKSLELTAGGHKVAGQATLLLANANKTLGAALRFSVVWIKAQTAALLQNPLFRLGALIVATAAFMWQLITAQREYIQSWYDLKKAHNDVNKAIDSQIAAMKTLDDQYKAEIDITEQLIKAQEKLKKMREDKGTPKEQIGAQENQVIGLMEKRQAAREVTGLGGGAAEKKLLEERAQRDLSLKETEYQNQMTTGSEATRRLLVANKINELQGKDTSKLAMEDEDVALKRFDEARSTDKDKELVAKQMAARRRASTSDVVRMAQEAADFRAGGDHENADIVEKKAIARRKELEGHDTTQSSQLQAEYEMMKVAQKREKINVDAETELAKIAEEGLAAAERESTIRIGALEKQIELAQDRLDVDSQATLEAAKQAAIRDRQMRREQAEREQQAIHSALLVERNRTAAVESASKGDYTMAGAQSDAAREEEQAQIRRERTEGLKSSVADPKERERIVNEEQAQRDEEYRVNKEAFLERERNETEIMKLEGTKGEGKRGALQKATVLRDVEGYKEEVNKGLAMGLRDDELKTFAQDRVMADIAKRGEEPQAIASSLAAIGGGGDVGVINPLLTVAQEQKAFLAIIAGNTKPEDVAKTDANVLFN